MADNNSLQNAKAKKNNEFYTKLSDIENEIKYYKEHFKDKIVYCNCDDPEWSNFFLYFKNNFQHLQLKKLISTHYTTDIKKDKAYKIECIEIFNKEGHLQQTTTYLEGDGDFRSPECIELLKESDIVCTNPPFSLFREYIAQLIEYEKKFIIIGSQNAITYREVFKLIKDNLVWIGVTKPKEFMQPNKEIKKFGNIGWYTNLPHQKRNQKIPLNMSYSNVSDLYVKYDNYDAININKVKNIPVDYSGYMGVPISFLEKHNPQQFEIIGLIAGNIKGLSGMISNKTKDGPYINGKLKFGRIIIKSIN